MRWLADECVSARLVAELRSGGHEVMYVAECVAELRSGGHEVMYVAELAPRASDAEVLRFAEEEMRLLLTDDKDFGELVFRQRRLVPGVVLLRVPPDQPIERLKRLQAAIEQFGDNLFGRYTVIEEGRLRSRALPI